MAVLEGKSPSVEGKSAVVEEELAKRWTAKRRSALVLSLLRGETSSQEAARQHGLTVAEIEEWKDRFSTGAENALREAEVKRLKQKVGELVMEMDIFKEAARPYLPKPSRRQMLDE